VSDVTPTPPGWYPDPHVPGGQRWWDGGQWTEHAQAPYSMAAGAAALKAPEGTDPNTVWIWLVALLPLLSFFSLFTIDLGGYMRSIVSNPESPSSVLGLYTSPGYLLTVLGGWVLIALGILFAFLDWRALKARAVPQPFHWAFAFFALMGAGLVYVIGRGIVAKRRTGRGMLPTWVAIAVYVLGLIISLVWVGLAMQAMFAAIPTSLMY
jgi:hypothetical protein